MVQQPAYRKMDLVDFVVLEFFCMPHPNPELRSGKACFYGRIFFSSKCSSINAVLSAKARLL
jgi:hypothetical protein